MSSIITPDKILKTVTLKPGEKFTLPPDSVVVSSTGALSSTCNNIPPVADLECYSFMSVQQNDTGNQTEPWQEDNIYYRGILVNGNEYIFDSPVSWIGQGEDLPNAIKSTAVGGLFTSFNYGSVTESRGTKAYFVFKIPVGAINSLELLSYTGTFFGGSGNFYYNVKALKRSELIDQGHANVPDCV